MQNTDFNSALQLHQAGNYAAAKEIYTQILAADKNNVAVLHLLGILSAQENNFTLAKQYLTQALNSEPNSPTLHNSMGNVLKNNDQLDEALQHFNIALQQQPNNAVLHNNIAIVQQKLGCYKEAIKHYQQAITLQANYADAHYNLSLVLIYTNALIEAIEQLKITIELQPKHASALCQLAQIYQQQQNEDALILYQKSLKIDRNNITAQHNLGSLLLAKNKFAAAIRHFKKVLNIDPLHKEAFYNLGVAFLRQKNPEAALKYFLRLAQFSKDFNVYYNLGVIYNDINRTNDAISYFNEALKLNKEDFATHVNLGAIYLKQQNYIKALQHYTKAAQIQPQNKEINYTLAAINQNQTPTTAPQEYIQNLFDTYAQNYDKHLALLEYQAPQIIYEAINAIIKPPHNSLNILDLGCGTGLCGEKIRIFSHKLIGVDISKKMLEIAKQKKFYDELQQNTLENALKNYQNIDLIIAADTFPYVGDLDNIFSLCKKTLKNSAFFVFTVEKYLNIKKNNARQNNLNIKVDMTSNNEEYILQRTLRFAHSAKYIEKLAQKHTFKIITQSTVNVRKQHENVVESFLYILQG